ncbi:MAG: electron transfer flavoprotein subunit beta/FixA family protein [Chloroflexota bacterium]
MHIIVTVKQVPDPDIPPSHFKVDEAARKVIPPTGVAPVMNGYDGNALEAALKLKEATSGKVTVVTLGQSEARDALKRAIAMGADSAVLIDDQGVDKDDALATARVLAAAVTRIGGYDLVLGGRQASDTDGGQVILALGELLGHPTVGPVIGIDPPAGGRVRVSRMIEDGSQVLDVAAPAVLAISSEIGEPRYPPLRGIMMAGRAQIPVWTAAELGVDGGSPKRTLTRLFVETRDATCELIQADTADEAGALLAERLREAKLI